MTNQLSATISVGSVQMLADTGYVAPPGTTQAMTIGSPGLMHTIQYDIQKIYGLKKKQLIELALSPANLATKKLTFSHSS